MEAAKRKNDILICAKRLFSEKGYYQTQISDIVSEAKIARGTIYQYFKNKDDIFITLLKNFYDQWINFIRTDNKNIDLPHIDPREYFLHEVKSTLLFLANDPDLCSIVLRVGIGLRGQLEHVINQFEIKIKDTIIDDLNMGIRNGNVKEDLDVDLVSELLSGGMFNVAYNFFVIKNSHKEEDEIQSLSQKILFAFDNIFI